MIEQQQYQLVEEIILEFSLGVYLLGDLEKWPRQTTNKFLKCEKTQLNSLLTRTKNWSEHGSSLSSKY